MWGTLEVKEMWPFCEVEGKGVSTSAIEIKKPPQDGTKTRRNTTKSSAHKKNLFQTLEDVQTLKRLHSVNFDLVPARVKTLEVQIKGCQRKIRENRQRDGTGR